MAELYVRLILSGKKKLSDVRDEKLRNEVKRRLSEISPSFDMSDEE